MKDRQLLKLWRRAVLAEWKGRCAFCAKEDVNDLECHHIVKRRNRVLRYDYRNGIPLCKTNWGGRSCHSFSHTKRGEDKIRAVIPEYHYNYLMRMELKTLKDFLQEENLTREEFYNGMATELKEKIKEEKFD